MPELVGRDLYLVKKALAMAVISIQRAPEGPFRPDSDMTDMKQLLEQMVARDEELAHYARSARTAITGNPE